MMFDNILGMGALLGLMTFLSSVAMVELLRRNYAWPKKHPGVTYILVLFSFALFGMGVDLVDNPIVFGGLLGMFQWVFCILGIAELLRWGFAWPKKHPGVTYILAFFLALILLIQGVLAVAGFKMP